jgi:ATP-dependent protease ClpP protease subunit
MFKSLIVLALTGLASAATAAPIVQSKRSVVVAGVIANNNLADIGDQLLEWSKAKPTQPVDIVIDSPGGDTVTGFLFVNQLEAVRARGTTIRCFVPTIAASMAFQILLHCDERYTLDHSWLLWHGVRVFSGNSPITAKVAEELADELNALNVAIMRELLANLGLPEPVVRYHFLKETLHVGKDLSTLAPRFITALPAIKGLYEAMRASPRSAAPGGLGGGDVFEPGQIIYLAPNWLGFQ